VIVEPGGAHAGANVLHSGFGGGVAEFSTFVLVEILAAEIIGDIQAGPAASVVVAPGGGEAVAVVILIDPAGLGDVLEISRAIRLQAVPEREVGRAILRIVIRHRVAILGLALEIDVRADVKIYPSVAIIVGGRHAREGALRRTAELEGARPHR